MFYILIRIINFIIPCRLLFRYSGDRPTRLRRKYFTLSNGNLVSVLLSAICRVLSRSIQLPILSLRSFHTDVRRLLSQRTLLLMSIIFWWLIIAYYLDTKVILFAFLKLLLNVLLHLLSFLIKGTLSSISLL